MSFNNCSACGLVRLIDRFFFCVKDAVSPLSRSCLARTVSRALASVRSNRSASSNTTALRLRRSSLDTALSSRSPSRSRRTVIISPRRARRERGVPARIGGAEPPFSCGRRSGLLDFLLLWSSLSSSVSLSLLPSSFPLTNPTTCIADCISPLVPSSIGGHNLSTSRCSCLASSTVGVAIMRLMGTFRPLELASRGSRNASDLPVPVGEARMAFCPDVRIGKAAIWTAVGSINAASSNDLRRTGPTGRGPHAMCGGGADFFFSFFRPPPAPVEAAGFVALDFWSVLIGLGGAVSAVSSASLPCTCCSTEPRRAS
mmetsp:Transcript_34333/g.100983  ORF Transcript_34333/g.100983 Transcript_34333/m.100983 type:complete len:314 (-) Transcript_34333:37-978(-)